MAPRPSALHQAWMDILQLEEDKARDRGTNHHKAYKIARQAISQSKQTFTDVDDLRQLKGIGPTIIKLLKKRCEEERFPGAGETLRSPKDFKKVKKTSVKKEKATRVAPTKVKKSKGKAKVIAEDDVKAAKDEIVDEEDAMWASLGVDDVAALGGADVDDKLDEEVKSSKKKAKAIERRPARPFTTSRYTHPARQPSTTSAQRHPLDVLPDPPIMPPSTFVPQVWPAGTFRVVLLIDHRERVFRVGSADPAPAYESEEFAEADNQAKAPLAVFPGMFRGRDVEVDTKCLPLGDFVWVARRDGEEDVVLDTIVERKREDDLFHSIKDSRLLGQKLRMEASGAKHLICIVERYEKAHREGYLKAGIATTKMRLQLNHGFQLQETESTEDTVSFLTLRHHVMRDVFETQDLHIIPSDSITRASHLSLLSSLTSNSSSNSKAYYIPLSSFILLNAPHALRHAHTTFGRLLLASNGMTPERALDLIARFKTPKALFETCRQVRDDVEEMQMEMQRDEVEAGNGNGGELKNDKGKQKKKKGGRKVIKPEKLLLERIEKGSRLKGVRAIGDKRAKDLLDLWCAASSSSSSTNEG